MIRRRLPLSRTLVRAAVPALLAGLVLLEIAPMGADDTPAAHGVLSPGHALAAQGASASQRTGASHRAAAARGASASADALDARTLLDGFEDPAWPNPDLWVVSGNAPPTWWPSTCRAKSGRRALWAFGGMVGGGELACGAGAPTEAASSIVQRLDLRGAALASRLELGFELWMQLPPGPDTGLFIFLRVPQPGGGSKRVPVFGATGGGGSWVFPPRRLDLMNLADISDPREVYDLRGGVWELEWLALAPAGTAPGAGVYIDDVTLEWEPDAAVTPPTPRPTGGLPTPTASSTPRPATPTPSPIPQPSPTSTASTMSTPTSSPTPPAPTRRPTPGSEDTPTPRPTGGLAYLPWSALGEVLRTDTPTPTGSETPTAPTPGTPTPTEPPKPPPLYLPWTAWEAVPPEPTAQHTPALTPETTPIARSGPAPTTLHDVLSSRAIGDHR